MIDDFARVMPDPFKPDGNAPIKGSGIDEIEGEVGERAARTGL